MLGGIFVGKIIDKFGTRIAVIACGISVILAFALMLGYLYWYKFSLLTFFVTFFWGL